MSQIITELEPCPLLRDLTRAQLIDVFELVEQEQFAEGEMILEQENVYQSLWMIVRGKCEVTRSCGPNDMRQLAVLDAGGVFGEMSFFQEAPHSANIHALTNVETVRLSTDAFKRLQTNNLAAAYGITANLVRLLSDRLRRMDTWTCELIVETDNDQHYDEWQDFQSKLYTDWAF